MSKKKKRCNHEYKHFDFRSVGGVKFEIRVCKKCGNKINVKVKEGYYEH